MLHQDHRGRRSYQTCSMLLGKPSMSFRFRQFSGRFPIRKDGRSDVLWMIWKYMDWCLFCLFHLYISQKSWETIAHCFDDFTGAINAELSSRTQLGLSSRPFCTASAPAGHIWSKPSLQQKVLFPEGYLKIVTKHQNFNIQIVASLKLSPHLISVLVLLVISVVHQIASPCSKPMDLRLFSAQCLQPRWSPSHCLQPWAALTDALT